MKFITLGLTKENWDSNACISLQCLRKDSLKKSSLLQYSGIVFTHGVRMGGRAVGKSLSGLYLKNCKV